MKSYLGAITPNIWRISRESSFSTCMGIARDCSAEPEQDVELRKRHVESYSSPVFDAARVDVSLRPAESRLHHRGLERLHRGRHSQRQSYRHQLVQRGGVSD